MHVLAITGVRRELALDRPDKPTQTTMSIALLKPPAPPAAPAPPPPRPKADADAAHAECRGSGSRPAGTVARADS